ncbi:sulfatase [Lentisphaera profundi]|uniref:Sulfatase n=1 Tax=Lentisphaera profundi TaxID=1658616 RepID=A0ABY7VR08_9BACT|nr:sulfatase [Lentisphaera profundi]WDE96452.1 sulfatase [Lentisphaera profundi]
MKIYLYLLILMSLYLSAQDKPNVLFIISDDLCATAIGAYGNKVCKTPNIDRLANEGTLFKKAYCQATYCGPSRASFMSGYYPDATGVFGYVSGRKAIGDRETWTEYFKNQGYHTTRVSKIFHMPVPKGIELGNDGSDDARSWSEKYNSQGPEWKAPGLGETLEGNSDGKRPVVGGNTFVRVEADGDDLVHSDGRSAKKACELIEQYKNLDKPFFLGIGFVRPHVPFVAPKKYYKDYPWQEMQLPEKVKGDWDDIPTKGINYKTSKNMKMSVEQQKKAISAYYASVTFMDAQVGKVLDALERSGQRDNTIVIFTSDHGYHLGEHDFWAKVSLKEESVKVPLIISLPNKKSQSSESLVELIDLFPTTAALCSLDIPERLQGKNISKILREPQAQLRNYVFSANNKGWLIQGERWSYIKYKGKAPNEELFDLKKDPRQYKNLVKNPEHIQALEKMRSAFKSKMAEIKKNDL